MGITVQRAWCGASQRQIRGDLTMDEDDFDTDLNEYEQRRYLDRIKGATP